MKITASQVKALRDKTGVGMMDCKKALVENDGDMDKAIEYLQIKGMAKAGKRAGRVSSEGVVHALVNDTTAVLLEVNCETDFVARNDDFKDFVATIANHIAAAKPADVDALKAQTLTDSDKTVEVFVTENAAKIGENLVVNRFALYELSGDGLFGSYIHHDGKTGVLVEFNTGSADAAAHDDVVNFAKQVSMHIAASKPESVAQDGVDDDTIAKQRAIFEAQGLETGKPANIVTKIAEGRLKKWLKEICLVEQPFVMDTDKTVGAMLKALSKAAGTDISIARFARFAIGEKSDEGDDDA